MGVGGWGFDIVDFFEEMEGNSCFWEEDDVAIAVGIFVLCLDDSGKCSLAISKSPDRSFLIDFGSPPIPIIALWITKGDFRAISQFGNNKIKKLEHLATLSIRRRRKIPYDFQRTSLAGLALDSATSSGLGRAPRSAMQDPIQAPPGTTRQAGLYTS
ncbi:hypothetical protein TNCV_5087051 [Trichonephila clavipes]|nr:hypothetical protein TNCV_5087051 [Trichonephila clavipes]